ncbi:MAG: tetratricopeptide repeat protein [Pyrinomonadaceae bacterium]|nr:tetratricopeptide repeat protein [Pyrinomonadaceae bacterium]
MASSPQINDRTLARRYYSPLIAVAIAVLCLWGMWSAGRGGISRLFSTYQGWPALTDKGANMSPSDPEARFAYAVALSRIGEHHEAIREFERAVALRPRHYLLWMELGRIRSQVGDLQGALAAFKEAVRYAPYYAQPRWQLGDVLYKMNRRDEAFAELRRAAASDPNLLPSFIDLAWAAYGEDADAVRQAVQPQTTATYLALARFFADQGEINGASHLFRAAGDTADWERRQLLKELLAANRFLESYTVWASGREDRDSGSQSGVAVITDGSFESEIDAEDDEGFGWQLVRDMPTVRVARDNNEPGAGTHSLRVDWNGASHPSTSVVSQLVLVEPKMRYRLNFKARTQNVVTGELPVVTVIDAGPDGRTLVQTEPLPSGTSGWQEYTVQFATSGETRAVRIIVQRQNCTGEPCPIFGRVWFDAFSLQKFS